MTTNSPSTALWQAFADGHQFLTENGETVTTRIADAGALVLPTGRIVASDPILDPFSKPFTISVPSGAYPVLLSLIKDDVALVMVHFAEGTPVRWESARPDCFGVDSATGCLMDYRVCRFLRRKAESADYEKYSRRFEGALDEHDGMWGSCSLNSASGANVVLFHTWGGDGVFPAFYGFDSHDQLLCLVIDMYLYDHVRG